LLIKETYFLRVFVSMHSLFPTRRERERKVANMGLTGTQASHPTGPIRRGKRSRTRGVGGIKAPLPEQDRRSGSALARACSPGASMLVRRGISMARVEGADSPSPSSS
jgi:hypothetical protein